MSQGYKVFPTGSLCVVCNNLQAARYLATAVLAAYMNHIALDPYRRRLTYFYAWQQHCALEQPEHTASTAGSPLKEPCL